MHPADGSGPPDGHGSGTPDHQMGDGDGKIQERLPDNAKPNMRHKIHAVQDDPHGTLTWLEDNDPRGHDWVMRKFESYMVDAPFPADSSKADDILHATLMLYAVRSARHRQVTQGLTQRRPLTDENNDPVVSPKTGEVVEIEDEQPVNLPANRMAREARSILKSYGLLDDPESKKAEAMGWSQAAKEVAMEVDEQAEQDRIDSAAADGRVQDAEFREPEDTDT
jgi:hypothetical protein